MNLWTLHLRQRRQEYTMEKRQHSSIPAWKILWMEESGRLQFMGCKESEMIEQLTTANAFLDMIPKSVSNKGKNKLSGTTSNLKTFCIEK